MVDSLQEKYTDALVFRIHGDDFVVFSRNHIDIETEFLNSIEFIKNSDIWISVRHFHSKEENITSSQSLEQVD